MALSADGTRLVGSYRGEIRVLDTATLNTAAAVGRQGEHAVIAVSRDGALVVSGDSWGNDNNTVKLWRLRPAQWTPALHRHYSRGFRAAVRTLLLVWHSRPDTALAQLPHELLLVVVEQLAAMDGPGVWP